MSIQTVSQDRVVAIVVERGQRPVANALLDSGLYTNAIRLTQPLALASDPHTITHWAASTVERSAFAPILPAMLGVYRAVGHDVFDTVGQHWRVRYHDDTLANVAAGYAVTQIYDDATKTWVERDTFDGWLATLGLVRYQSLAPPDDIDAELAAAIADDVTLTPAQEQALVDALAAAAPIAFAAAGITPQALRDTLDIGPINAAFLGSDL